ncbi:MAG: hypothetical protein A2107_00210 [Verrucomicrobia bacterium GWF2_62_7]|nr:MAG: hypothetical protein A2107_00210 [Verrucomicrobia bacterium GWF2_62_7]
MQFLRRNLVANYQESVVVFPADIFARFRVGIAKLAIHVTFDEGQKAMVHINRCFRESTTTCGAGIPRVVNHGDTYVIGRSEALNHFAFIPKCEEKKKT